VRPMKQSSINEEAKESDSDVDRSSARLRSSEDSGKFPSPFSLHQLEEEEEDEEEDFTEQLGDLNLKTIMASQKSKTRCSSFEPDSSWRTTWDMVGLVFIIYQSLVIPYRLSFDATAEGGLYSLE